MLHRRNLEQRKCGGLADGDPVAGYVMQIIPELRNAIPGLIFLGLFQSAATLLEAGEVVVGNTVNVFHIRKQSPHKSCGLTIFLCGLVPRLHRTPVYVKARSSYRAAGFDIFM